MPQPKPQWRRTLNQLTPEERHRIDQRAVTYMDEKLLNCIDSIVRQTATKALIDALQECRKILAAAVKEPPA